MTSMELVNSLKPGNVINMDWDPHILNPLRIVHFFIRWYQKRKYGKHSNYRDVHSTLYMGDGYHFSVTVPRAVVEIFKPVKGSVYTIANLKTAEGPYVFTTEDMDIIYKYVSKIVKNSYDYGQLIDILLCQLFPSYEKHKLSLFDMGKKRKVCSVGVHAALLFLWKEKGKTFPRPLGNQYVEITCPADFVNHNTFEIVNVCKIV